MSFKISFNFHFHYFIKGYQITWEITRITKIVFLYVYKILLKYLTFHFDIPNLKKFFS